MFIDTNVLVYAYDMADQRKQKLAQNLLTQLLKEDRGVISTQVLAEFYTIVTKKSSTPLIFEESQRLIDIFATFFVQEINLTIVKKAIDIHKRYKISFWDGQIIAAAEFSGCSTVFSEDLSSGHTYQGLLLTNPFVRS